MFETWRRRYRGQESCEDSAVGQEVRCPMSDFPFPQKPRPPSRPGPELKLIHFPAHSLLPSSLYLLCRSSHSLHSQGWCRLNHVDANSESSYWDDGAAPTIRHGCGESAQHHPSKRLEFLHRKRLTIGQTSTSRRTLAPKLHT